MSSKSPNSLQIWFYLFVFSLAFAPVSVAARVYTEKWNALPERLLPSFFFHSPVLFFPTVLHSHVWGCLSNEEQPICLACTSLSLPPPSLAASLPFHANLTYKFCPSVTNESVVELRPNSFLSVSSCSVSPGLCPPSLWSSPNISPSFTSDSLTRIPSRKSGQESPVTFFSCVQTKAFSFCSGPSCCVCVTQLESVGWELRDPRLSCSCPVLDTESLGESCISFCTYFFAYSLMFLH